MTTPAPAADPFARGALWSAGLDPVLVLGGTGVVGSALVRHLRRLHPNLPLAIGARTARRLEAVSTAVDCTEPFTVDVMVPGLLLPAHRGFSAVVAAVPDAGHHAQRHAQERGVPFVNLAGGVHTIAQELTVHLADPGSSTVVHASSWAAGMVSALTLRSAEHLQEITSVTLIAGIDPHDELGPANDEAVTAEIAGSHPLPLTASGGGWSWTRKRTRSRLNFETVSGDAASAREFSSVDVLVLGDALRPARTRFAIAVEDSSATLTGQDPSHDIVVLLRGRNRHGAPVVNRYDLIHPGGLGDLTGLGAALLVERLLSLDGGLPPDPGFHYADRLLHGSHVLRRLGEVGARFARSAYPVTTDPVRAEPASPA
ncbi:hypothetical protein MO973_45175 [Paenibacillus sp. TRM 82003]|uniref:hypothetical protein n=1 Tax=Kineococcus sp. TRM81007 TaxID=2925831 RepID=UPI001F56D258|nr:hypothetical protein [Kineococcus sp. TRM81007]MCI2240436.1 hypothetical protein [Kineococcus sp. TRM81007]MCI3927388.1 hypothetical protein [Paenibacillus sp. TRM 82003]